MGRGLKRYMHGGDGGRGAAGAGDAGRGAATVPPSEIAEPARAGEGEALIAWVRRHMPILRGLEERFSAEQPFAGLRIAVSVHLEAKTAYLARVLAAGGAQVTVTGSNPLSTNDAVVAALAAGSDVAPALSVYARRGATGAEFHRLQALSLRVRPHIVIDDGGDLVHLLHTDAAEWADAVVGACEETTAGVQRNRARAAVGELRMPVIAVNFARMKHLFDNRYGTGQSTMDAIMRSTNLLVTGQTVVVAGYGWCGRGIAARAAGMGAHVVVCEIDEVAALEAIMDGYQVMPMGGPDGAAARADFIISAAGVPGVVSARHHEWLRDGVVLANAGHFGGEIDEAAIEGAAVERTTPRPGVTSFRLADGRWINLLAEGQIVNIAAADGHPAEIMDTSFAVQALSAHWLAGRMATDLEPLPPEVIAVPEEIDREVARLRLEAVGVAIDELTDAQRAFLDGYER